MVSRLRVVARRWHVSWAAELVVAVAAGLVADTLVHPAAALQPVAAIELAPAALATAALYPLVDWWPSFSTTAVRESTGTRLRRSLLAVVPATLAAALALADRPDLWVSTGAHLVIGLVGLVLLDRAYWFLCLGAGMAWITVAAARHGDAEPILGVGHAPAVAAALAVAVWLYAVAPGRARRTAGARLLVQRRSRAGTRRPEARSRRTSSRVPTSSTPSSTSRG